MKLYFPYWFPLFFSLLMIACSQKQENTLSTRLHKEIGIVKKPFNITNKKGDTISTGIPTPAKGVLIDPDSVAKPTIVPIQRKPNVVQGPYKVVPAGIPQTIPVPQALPVITPGRDGNPLPKTISSKGKEVPVKQPKVVPASPPRRKDASVYHIQYLGVDQGMISSAVSSILQDSQGNLWFGTKDYGGLSCYDGNSFRHYTSREGLSLEAVNSLLEDSQGNIWIGTEGGGLNRFDGQLFTHFTTEEGLSDNRVWSMLEDSKGNLWFGTGNGVNRYDPDAYNGQGSFTHFTTKEGLSGNRIVSMHEDHHGNLWFGSFNGVSRFDPNTNEGQGSFTHFTTKEGLSNNRVSSMLEDHQGNLWFGTGKGVNRFDPDAYNGQGSFTHFTRKEGLNTERVYAIFEDSQRNLWFGSFNGVSRFDPNAFDGKGSFTHFTEEEGLSNNFIYTILEDSHGNFWFGTGGGANCYYDRSFTHFTTKEGLNNGGGWVIMEDKEERLWFGTDRFDGQSFTHFSTQEGLSNNIVTSMLQDKVGNLWIGTYGGINHFDSDANDGQGSFTHLTTDQGLSNNLVHTVLEDINGYLWFGTRNGLSRYDPKDQGVFTNFTSIKGVQGYWPWSILEDKQGNLWIGTNGGGLVRFANNYYTQITIVQGLMSNEVRSIFEDSQGHLWIGTNGWVSRFANKSFTHFPVEQNLGGNLVHSIIEDRNNNLWVSTQKSGVMLMVPFSKDSLNDRYQIFSFTKQDGLLSSYITKLYLDSKNRLWMGSRMGISMLDLDRFEIPTEPPRNVHFTHIEVEKQFIDYRRLIETNYQNKFFFGKELSHSFDSVARFQNYPLNLSLPYYLNHLTFHFSAIDWMAPHKIKYSFKMEGLDNNWSPPQSEPKADYRNLSHGTFTLHVKAIGAAQVWSEPFEYSFTILPPWWLTWWAKVLYGLLVASGLYGLYQFLLNRRLAQAETLRLKELDEIKTKLYTNITHEFRTPLTIMLGMIDKIVANPTDWLSQGADMIKRNSQNLLRLVNQMLDLSKLEAGKYQLNMVQGDILHFLRYIMESFHSYAETKNIRLHFHSDEEEIFMDYDPDNLLNLVSNLLSNAVKFTNKGGDVYMEVAVGSQQSAFDSNSTQRLPIANPCGPYGCLLLTIRDTGIGIPAKQLPHIFDRFHQVDDSPTRKGEGTGIGLALTKELVKLMEGEIQVKSTLGRGTTFTVFLPIQQTAPMIVDMGKKSVKEEVNVFTHPRETDKVTVNVDRTTNEEKPTALIIEDNIDVVRFLYACLESNYNLEVAYNGQQGITKALEIIPDIIISDVMMPKKDGLEVCDTLKNDVKTSHIPIILLTAKADIESKLSGLKRGADIYLAKPFHQEELQIQMHNLIQQRIKLQARYQGEFSVAVSKSSETKIEDAFLLKIKELVEDNITKADFDISWLASQVHMGRVQLYRKIKALTGNSPSIFVRMIRLQHARKLLLTTDLNISEIAYDVGFSDPAFFSKCFKEEFGLSPTELKNS